MPENDIAYPSIAMKLLEISYSILGATLLIIEVTHVRPVRGNHEQGYKPSFYSMWAHKGI